MKHLFEGCMALVLFLTTCLLLACSQPSSTHEPPEIYFTKKNAQHNGDYLATFPLHNPDSCLLRVKAEIPRQYQPWACLSIWYRIPRSQPQTSLRWLDLYEQNYPHDTVTAFVQMVRSEFMVEMNKLDTARALLADARARYLKLGRALDASDADYLVGRCYLVEGKYAKSLEACHRVLDLINSHDTTFSHRHANLYSQIAYIHAASAGFREAIFWQQKILDADPARLDPAWRYKAMAASHISTCFAQLEHFDSSLLMAQHAIMLFRANSSKPLPAELAYRLGFAYTKKQNFGAALPLFRQAHATPTGEASSFMENQIEQGLAECYFGLGRLDSAAFFLQKSFATPDKTNLAAGHRLMADIYARRGQFREAYEASQKSNQLFKAEFQAEKATALAEFKARYETAELAHRFEKLEAEHEIARQRNLIFGLLGLSAVVVLVALFLRQRARRRFLEQEKQILEKDRTLLAQEKQLAEALAQFKAQELERTEANLKFTQDELSATTRLLGLKNQLIEELEMRLHNRHTAPADDSMPGVADGPGLLSMKILTDVDWAIFRERFEESFPNFLTRLKTLFPEITAAETRLFLLMKLNFEKREIADALGISHASVWRSRHRLSKKLGLSETGDLDEFIRQFA